MELHQLRYFMAVAEEGNFTRAAEKCFVSQPSLSAQIIKLEGELGEKLFNRLGRRAELTQAGRFLEHRASNILMEVENAERQIREGAAEISGIVRIGAAPSVTPYLIPKAIAACREKYPKLTVHIQESLRRKLIEDVVHGNLDLAITSYKGDMPSIDAEPLLQESLLLAVPSSHALASKAQSRVSLDDFKDEPIILLGESTTLGDKVFDFFDLNHSKPNVVALCSQVRTLKEFVNVGMGVAIVPEMARDEGEPFDIVYLSLVSARMSRLVFALTHSRRYVSPASRVFIELVRDVIAERLSK